MTLASLIDDLREETNGRNLSSEDSGKLIDGKIELPGSLEERDYSVEFKNLNFGSGENYPHYHLRVSGFVQSTLDELQPILDEVFLRAKGLRLKPGQVRAEYRVLWTPEAFQDERRLTGLFFDDAQVRSSLYTCDPTKTRIGMPGQRHEIKAVTNANIMTITASGLYRNELRGMINRFHPQYIKLNLTKDDTERLLRDARKSNRGSKSLSRLEAVLQPQSRYTMSLSIGGGIGFGTQDVIEFAIPASLLQNYENAIGKSLVGTNGNGGVTELIKIYSIRGIFTGERLKDLQTLARDIPQIDLGLLYNHPVLTLDAAKKMLDKEIEIITKGYENHFFFGMNSHMMRGGLVKRLAFQHFGDEVLAGFDSLSVNDYVNFLKTRGYVEPSAESVESESTRQIYARARAEGKMEERAFASEPDYIAKERHLLEFFRQSYGRDPRESVQRFREFYQNTAPQMNIFAISKENDASRLRKLKLPSKSRLYSFGLSEDVKATYYNDLSIDRTLPNSDSVHFFSRTSVDSPRFLHLQEYACAQMGINFRSQKFSQ